MNRSIAVVVALAFSVCSVSAQVTGRVQQGVVRSQSFVKKSSSPIEGAIVKRKDEKVNPAISDRNGDFELSMEKLDNNGVYYIGSVEGGDKKKKYKQFLPLPDDKQQYKPDSKLIVIMQSEAETNAYVRGRIAEIKKYYANLFSDSLAVLQEKLEKSQISEQEYNRVSSELDDLCNNGPKLMETYLRNIVAHSDFESLDSVKQEISMAVYEGNYSQAMTMLEKFGSFDDWWKEYSSRKTAEDELHEINVADAENRLFVENQKIEIGLKSGEHDVVLQSMKNRIKIQPNSVNFLCELGYFEEIILNSYLEAKDYYFQAAKLAEEQHLSTEELAICYNHLGDVCYTLSEFKQAQEFYKKALSLIESSHLTNSRVKYDSQLGLGKIHIVHGEIDSAKKFFKIIATPEVEKLNSRAYWQSRLGLAQILLTTGDFQNARKECFSMLNAVLGKPEIDIETKISAYSSVIGFMTTTGKYQEAIDSCESAKQLIVKCTSANNSYMAEILHLEASAMISIGMIKEGETLMNHAIAIYKTILGDEHPNYAASCVMFSNYYVLIGDLRKAAEMSDKALSLMNKKFGKNHLATINAHLAKAELYKAFADFNNALAEVDTIRQIYKDERLLNDFYKIQINSYEASLKMLQGEIMKAISTYQVAIDAVTKTYGNETQQLIGLYTNIAFAYLQTYQLERGKLYLDKAQLLANKIFGKESPMAIMQQMGLGQYYELKGNVRQAIEIYSKIEEAAQSTFGKDSYQLYRLYQKLGDYYLSQYCFDKAKSYYDHIYQIVEDTYGGNHFVVAEPLTKLGAYYLNIGKFQKGLEKELEAYNILSGQFGDNQPQTFNTRYGLFSSYMQLGQIDKAETTLMELMRDVEISWGKENNFYASLLYGQAIIQQRKGEYNGAIVSAKKALTLYDKINGNRSSYHISLYELLCSIYSQLLDKSKAKEYNDLAIEIASNYYGQNNVGFMPHLLKEVSFSNREEAEKIIDRIGTVYSKSFGDSCIQMYSVQLAKAGLLQRSNRIDEALSIYEDLRRKLTTIYGEDNLNMVGLYNSMASVYQNKYRFDEAKELSLKALEIVEKNLGRNNVECIACLQNLGNLCMTSNTPQSLEQARIYYSRASTISLFAFGSNSPHTLNSDSFLALVYGRQGKRDKEYEILSKEVREYEQLGLKPYLAAAHFSLGTYYSTSLYAALNQRDSVMVMQSFENARKHIQESINIYRDIDNADNASTLSCYTQMANLYSAINYPDSALAIYEQVLPSYIKCYGEQSSNVAMIYSNIGRICSLRGTSIDSLAIARKMFEKAIEIMKRNEINTINMNQLLGDYILLSKVLISKRDSKNALKSIREGIKIAESSSMELQKGIRMPMFNCYLNEADILINSSGDSLLALSLVQKADTILSRIEPKPINLQMSLKMEYGRVYSKLGRIDESIQCNEEIYRILTSYHQQKTVVGLGILSALEQLRGRKAELNLDYDTAISHYKRVIELQKDLPQSDSIIAYYRVKIDELKEKAGD